MPQYLELRVKLPDPLESVIGDLLLLLARGLLDPIELKRFAELHRDLGELKPLPVSDLVGAQNRNRDYRNPRLEREPSDAWPCLIGELAGSRASPLGIHDDGLAAAQHLEGGLERLLVLMATPDREHTAVAEDVGGKARLEQLRLGHEPHPASQERAGEEVVHERAVVGGEDHRAIGDV